MTKIYGVVPARMASSRFPGKPLHPILGRPMIEHVFRRACLYNRFDGLYLATCDQVIVDFAHANAFPVVTTKNTHIRCLDRVSEAIEKSIVDIDENDIAVCVQGDEPMLNPAMIAAVVNPLLSQDEDEVYCTMLAMPIIDEQQFVNPDTVKIIHNLKGDVLYTSRAPIPHSARFDSNLGAKRVSGIFAFRWHFLKTFNQLPESPLELQESCDSNRIIDHGFKQRIAPFPYQPYFSVDSPKDIATVEAHITRDPLWGRY